MHSLTLSNSFLLAPNTTRPNRNPRLTVAAKKAGPFPSFRKQSDDSEDAENEASSSSSSRSRSQSSPFEFLKLGKLAGNVNVRSLIPAVAQPSGTVFQRRKDPSTVFVAGATGQTGARIAQNLLRQGFTVRAGVPDLGAALELARLAADYKIISGEESKKLNAVESSFGDAVSIAKSIGNASKVVVTIGPSENGPANGISTIDALKVIEASQLAGVSHVAVVYNDGVAAAASKNEFLNGITTFFGNIFAKTETLSIGEFLERVVQTDVKFTLIKTRLTEDYAVEKGYNLVVAAEGFTGANDFKVGKSQIASVVGDVFSNVAVAENKVVEVFTDPSAPARPVSELFSLIPEDGRRQAYAEATAAAKAEEEAVIAAQRAAEAALAAKKQEEEVKKLSEVEAQAAGFLEEAQKKAAEAGPSLESIMSKAKGFGKELPWDKLSAQVSNGFPKLEIPKVQIATVRGQAKAQNLPAQKAVVKKAPPPPKAIKSSPPPKEEKQVEVRKVFGGLFKQETIYIDDD